MNTLNHKLAIGLLVCLLATALSVHAQQLPEDPGTSAPKRTGQYYRADPASQPVKLRKDDLTVVVAARAKLQGSVFEGIGMVGQHGVAGFYSPNEKLTLYVNAPEADDYALSIILASPDVQTMEFKCGDSVIRTPSMVKQWLGSPRNWRQYLPGTLHLKKGVNEITFRLPESTVKPTEKNKQLATHIDQHQFMLYSIELGTPEARQAQLQRAKEIKGDSSWMVKGKYGLFIHFSANMYGWQSDTTRSEWFQESVKMFDVQHFADQVERTGAAWVNFTVTHQGFYWPGPNKAVDAVMPGRTTERDLLMEIVDELAKRNIDTLFYLHSGYNGVRAGEWRAALGAEYGSADTSRFNDNMVAILRECSLRYGKKIKGFGYIDGCLMHDYPLDPHWESWARAIKAGNPDAVIGFSSNQGPSVSPFSSLSTRDGGHSLAEANPELMGPGKQYGDVDPAWWCAMDTWCPHKPLKGEWTTGGPKRKTRDYVDYFERMAEEGVPVTINLSMTADVTDDHAIFDPECMAVMEEVREAIRGVAPDKSKQAAIDYAMTKAPPTQTRNASLPINPAGINVVAGNLGDYQPDFRNNFANHMNLWMSATKPGPCRITWKLKAPADGVYEVDALAAKGGEMTLSCNGKKQSSAKVGRAWNRVGLGSILLKEGENTLQLDVIADKGFQFDALELVQPKVKADLLQDALAMRQKPEWFSSASYGLMFQWTNRATPPKGPIKPWQQKVNDFDLDGFIKTVEESGASYVLWSITWGNQYISAPIQSLDDIIKGRTTQRDLLGEMADALHDRRIKLIFYYHYGYDCNHSIDADWMKASGGYKSDKTDFYRNWMAIVSEIGERYGDKLHGWWFDGGQRYYNCHFENSPGDKGILSAPFKELTLAARSGNPERIVAYNSWIKPRLTEYQDFYGGEGAHVASGLNAGSFRSGPQQGLLAHGCFIFERNWGHIKPDTTIPKPKFSLKKLTTLVRRAQREQSPLSINLEMYEDGSVSPDSIALLKQLNVALRDNTTATSEPQDSFHDGSNLSGVDFTKLENKSWSSGSFGQGAKTIWDGAQLSSMKLKFTGHNFGYNDSMRKVDFSGSTISTDGNQAFLFVDLTGADFSGATLAIEGFKSNMNAFRDAKLTGANFSNITWAVSTASLSEKTEMFFSGGPGSTSAADKDLAVTFAGADLSRITGAAKAAMIKNLGKFDGKTRIGAKYDRAMLTKSGWTAGELDAAGWQMVKQH